MSRGDRRPASRPRRLPAALLAVTALALAVAVTASAQFEASPKKGGTLVVGLYGTDPPSLDPALSMTNQATQMYLSFCQRLYDRDPKQQPVPLLAAALPVLSEDKLSYTVQLRKGVRFNDGTPFNAKAVVISVQRLMNHPQSSRKSDYTSVASVRASGPYSVVFRLKSRDAAFLANPWVFSPTQLAKVGDNFGANPVCVGPFMFDHRVPGDNITLVRSPYYFDQKNVFLDRIVFRPMAIAAAAVAALRAGDIQVLDFVATTELQTVRNTYSLRVIQAPQLGWLGVLFNFGNKNGLNGAYESTGKPFATSAKLRQAFEEAIDRAAVNNVVFGGLVQPSCSMVSPSNAAWYAATRNPCDTYDPDHARKLIAESGISNPTVRLLLPSISDRIALAQFIQAQEKAVGIDVVIEPSENANGRAISGDFDAYLSGWVPGGPDPHGNIHQFLATGGARNYGHYSNPRLDLILNNGLKATETKARSTLYRVAQQVIAADRPVIPLYNPVTFAAFNTSLTGIKLTSNGTLSVANARFK